MASSAHPHEKAAAVVNANPAPNDAPLPSSIEQAKTRELLGFDNSSTAHHATSSDKPDDVQADDEANARTDELDVPSEKVLHECNTVPEVLDALVDGLQKHLENLEMFTLEPAIDFNTDTIVTAEDLFRMVAQNAFNAGCKWRAERAFKKELRKRAAAKTALRHQERSKKREARKQNRIRKQNKVEEDEEDVETEDSGSCHDTGDSDTSEDEEVPFAAVGSVNHYKQQDALESGQDEYNPEGETAQISKKRKLASSANTVTSKQYHSLAAMEQDRQDQYTHPFGAVDGLYFASAPSTLLPTEQSGNNSPVSNNIGPSSREPVKKVTKKPARKYTATNATATKVKLQRGHGRTAKSKARKDWGIPRPKITKAEFFALRRHAKLTTKAFVKKGPNGIKDIKLTFREAIRYSNASSKFTYVKELGDVPSEDPTINSNLVRWENTTRGKIRRGLKARAKRQAKGDYHDSDSSVSEDEGQYDSGVDAAEALDDGEMIIAGEDEEAREERAKANRLKYKGKGRATKRVIEEDEDEETEESESEESERDADDEDEESESEEE